MAIKTTAPADGDRKDLGGKLPQFDAFAYFAYEELRRGDLSWIRVADPEALTLDDIQYATEDRIHAYQVKWSNQSSPEPFSYTDFRNLVPEIVAGYNKLRIEYQDERKSLVVHLLSNRTPSIHDSIKEGERKIGSFTDFLREVWDKLKSGHPVPPEWDAIKIAFQRCTGLDDQRFIEFIQAFELNLGFSLESFGVKIRTRRSTDLQELSRFLIETVANKERKVLFLKEKLIEEIGWSSRFETIFTHELAVDPSRYFPIVSTISNLNGIIDNINQGYVFLEGGPGTGKSTLLTQWANEREETVVKYYAFDFTNPASIHNTPRRAEAVTLFYDLVLQLNENGAKIPDTLIQKDIDFLTKAFSKQLEQLSEQYKSTGKKNFILVDGLDHVPREYKGVINSFLSYLPSPAALPEGVIIILGSQTFELENLKEDIKYSWRQGDRIVKMAALTREDVLEYIEKSQIKFPLALPEKEKIISISQGHPLYLSYLTNKIKHADNLGFLEDAVPFDGDIERYYRKEWEMIIGKEAGLTGLLALIARVEGDVSVDFIKEWGFSDHILRSFRKHCIHFFQESGNPKKYSFFHNSFRQFLIVETAKDPLDEQFNEGRHLGYHLDLAAKYYNSKIEPSWNSLFHFFVAGDYDRFLSIGTPNAFSVQFTEFRPEEEIKRDILFGIQIAKKRGDPYLLFRYVIALSEIEIRAEYIDARSFVEEFMEMGETELVKRVIRNNTGLLVSKETAMKVASMFENMGDSVEAKLLFSLSTPDEITKKGILVSPGYDSHNTIKKIEEWVGLAALYIPIDKLLEKIKSVQFEEEHSATSNRNINSLRENLCYIAGSTIIKKQRWNDFEKILNVLKQGNPSDRFLYGNLLITAARHCHNIVDFRKAEEWLQRALDDLSFFDNSSYRLAVADLVFLLKNDVEKVKELIRGIPQPEIVDTNDIEHNLEPFAERIVLNRLLNLTGQQVSVIEAVPESPKKDPVITEFERKICMIARISTDATQQIPLAGNIKAITKPIVEFFYTGKKYDLTWSKLRNVQKDYFGFLINAIARHGINKLNELMDVFFEAFEKYPGNWPAELKRSIFLSARDHGYLATSVEESIISLEESMLANHDISGKTEECSSQVRALLEVGQNQAALEQIKKALRQSEGIGYRKDYQLNHWMEWMQKANKVDPSNAGRRIGWFLSHLETVLQTTERYTFYLAVRKILRITAEYNSGWGISLAIWLINKGYCAVEVAMEVCIQQQVNQLSDPGDIKLLYDTYCYLYLFIAKEPSVSLLEELLEAGYKKDGQAFITTVLPQITNSILNTAPEGSRTDLLGIIQDFLDKKGLAVPENISRYMVGQSKKKESNSGSGLILSPPASGKTMSKEEVLKGVQNFNDFLNLYKAEDKVNSYFNWNDVLDKIGDTITVENIKVLFGEIKATNSRASLLLSQLAHLAHKLEATNLAKDIAEKALELSASSGWQSFNDGGTRLSAFRAIQEIDPENGFKRAFSTFADDITQKGSSRMEYESGDEILPIITPNPDEIRFWNEVESYLERLMATSTPIEDLPKFDQESSKKGLASLLTYIANLPAKEPRDRSRFLLIQAIVNGSLPSSIIQQNGGEIKLHRYWLIDMISLLHQAKASETSNFEAELKELANDKDLSIRLQARKILSEMTGQEISPLNDRPLSSVYEMDFPLSVPATPAKPLRMHDTISDTEDIRVLLHPFKSYIEFLSISTGLDPVSISQRVVQIIREGRMNEQLTTSFEKETNEFLKEIDLYYPFHRPRFEVIDFAIREAAAELMDAGKLVLNEEVETYFCRHDYFADIHIPFIEQPRFIQSVLSKRRTLLPDNWVSDIKNSERFKESGLPMIDEWYVIGEYSIQHSGSFQHPKEIYKMHVVTQDKRQPDLEEQSFGFVYKQLMDSYCSDSHCPAEPYLIVINKNDFDNSGLRTDWLAFNPAIGSNFEWHPSERVPLAWEDKEGRLVVRSTFWENGNLWMDSRESTASRGWIVLISEAGMQQIKQRYSLYVRKSMTRETRYDNKEEKNDHECFLKL
jgi:tetratricopeptide (TPR) repeat protein